MIVTTINTLIASNKLKDALKFIVGQCVGSLTPFKTNAIIFQGKYSKYKRDQIHGINRDSEINQLKIDLIEFAGVLENWKIHFEPDNLDKLFS